MRNSKNQKWSHYIKDFISADLYSAVLLVSYLREADKYKTYLNALEVMEFHPSLVPAVKMANMPEVLVVGKN
jgi:hypothetical protein